ncbi:hypothetical protein ACIQVK_03905 [Streptomyces sp. NPDC090493]|uniref:hypothetical protein n=1 Tax=Streptomyces sp. NPDC090493 TaxID=3365964 RepID=UPI00381E3DBF
MPLPAGVETVTVSSGEPLTLPDGTPIRGRLFFEGPGLVTIGADDVVLGGTVEAALADGEFSVSLVATDATGMSPTGWTYRVRAAFTNAPSWVRYVSLPKATPTVRLADIVTADPATSQTGRLVINATSAATTGYPIGVSGAVESLSILSSYAGGDDDGIGTDSTGRINLYSYQRANAGSFGENIRNFAMRSDAKTMQAFYIPVDATKKGGYDPSSRDPKASGVSWKPVVWQGAHYEANDHASIHGHWELEIADLSGALQGRLEIPFIDQVTDGTKALDQAAIGVAYTNIRTNLADLSVRAQNMTAGPYTGQNTCFRVGGNNTVNKDVALSISSDMGTTGRRWILRANSTTEAGANAGTDFQVRRYDDTGTFLDAPLHIERSTGRIGMGGVIAPTAGLHLQRATGQVLYLDAQATTQSAVLVNGVDATVKALQGQVSGDAQKRYQVLVDGTQSWGPGNAAADVTLGRGGTGVLAIGATATVTVAAATTTAYAALVSGDAFDRYRAYGDGKQEWGSGSVARDANFYRSNVAVLKTDGALQATTSLRLNTTSLGAGVGVVALANATTVPSANPTGGGVLYAEAGALKWRGSSGTVTIIAPA